MKDSIISPKNFFQDLLKQAFQDCQINTHKITSVYLGNLLEKYIEIKNLYDLVDEKGRKKRETLAEMYLKAFSTQTSLSQRKRLLKKLGDTSLYLTGFFRDSLKRKPIDVGYYINIGQASYKHLSYYTKEDTYSTLFLDFSKRFQDFVTAFTYISHQFFLQNEEGILKLYDAYSLHPEKVQRLLAKRGVYKPSTKKRKLQ